MIPSTVHLEYDNMILFTVGFFLSFFATVQRECNVIVFTDTTSIISLYLFCFLSD